MYIIFIQFVHYCMIYIYIYYLNIQLYYIYIYIIQLSHVTWVYLKTNYTPKLWPF